MIPDVAGIVTTYAAVRLLNEYVLIDAKYKDLRLILSLLALAVMGFFLLDVFSAGSGLSSL